jgi:ribosomal protein L30E
MYVVKKTLQRVKCGSQALVLIAAATRRIPAKGEVPITAKVSRLSAARPRWDWWELGETRA